MHPRTRPMLPFLSALVLSLLLAAPACAQPASSLTTLMPLPATLEAHTGTLPLSSSFNYALQGHSGPYVSQGAARLLRRIATRTGIPLATAPATPGKDAILTINVTTDLPGTNPQFGDDESYTLDIDAQHARIEAKTWIGALHGMQTLSQLVEPAGSQYVLPAVHIADAPRFPWRGLMLDCGRHFMPPAVIYRTLDGMAAVKLNVLHWHISEDQGFRIESKVFPKLQQLGSNGQYYTQQQVRDIIAYASARGIRIVPEFDMPGHSTSWMVGYPQLGSAPGPFAIADTFGVENAAMNPIRESTYHFLDAFLGEMAQLFPDHYMHIGGDESNGKEWRANPQIVAFMKAHNMQTTAELQTYFNQHIQTILARHHKQMVGWDEILNPKLPRQAVIQNWHGIEFLTNAAKQGHRGILSHPYYLDHMYSAADMFLADPLPAGSDLTPDQAKLILGGEACMWSEQVIPGTIDSRIWPRTAAVAERFWSPASDRDANDMYRRLQVESLRLDAEGLTHLTGPNRILRNLAGTTAIGPLQLFADTLQPVDFHIRSHQQHSSPAIVLNRLVDGVHPDTPLRHQFEMEVAGALKGNGKDAASLDDLFHSWIANSVDLDELEANSPLLQEDAAHIAAWPRLARMGLAALHYIDTGTAPPAGWQQQQESILKDANPPQELVDFVVLKPLQQLVEAASAAKPH